MIQGREPEDLLEERPEPRTVWPLDLMAICLVAVCMAVLIGVTAGLVWLRVFRPV